MCGVLHNSMFLLGIIIFALVQPGVAEKALDMRTFLTRAVRGVAQLAALSCGLLAPGLAAAGAADYPFRVVSSKTGAQYQLVAENKGPAPITVRVDVTGKDFVSDRQWPVEVLVPAHTTLTLGHVSPGEQSAVPFSARFDFSYHYGRLDAVHDAEAVYRLPFEDGQRVEVTQAYGGTLTSHDEPASQYAVDFAMPAGSAVLAARAGTVVDVTLRYTEGGFDRKYVNKANSVAVLHRDGTIAEYAHLSPGPPVVTAGERVNAGDLLGYSGSTGYSSSPHLHFSVARTVISDGQVVHETVPVEFCARDTAVRFSARTGTTVWANYAARTRIAALRPRRVP